MPYIIASSWEHQTSSGKVTQLSYDSSGYIYQPNLNSVNNSANIGNKTSVNLSHYHLKKSEKIPFMQSLWPITLISIFLVIAGFFYIAASGQNKSKTQAINPAVLNQTIEEINHSKEKQKKNISVEKKSTNNTSTVDTKNMNLQDNLASKFENTDKLKNAIIDLGDL